MLKFGPAWVRLRTQPASVVLPRVVFCAHSIDDSMCGGEIVEIKKAFHKTAFCRDMLAVPVVRASSNCLMLIGFQ